MATRASMPCGLWAKSTTTVTPPRSKTIEPAGILAGSPRKRCSPRAMRPARDRASRPARSHRAHWRRCGGRRPEGDRHLGQGGDRIALAGPATSRICRRRPGRRRPRRRRGPQHAGCSGSSENQTSGTVEPWRRGDQVRVVRVEHQPTGTAERPGHDQLGLGQAGQVVDPELAEVVLGDVGHDRGIGARRPRGRAAGCRPAPSRARPSRPAGRAAPAARRRARTSRPARAPRRRP